VSFGHTDDRSEADVRAVFAKWLDLYNADPQTVFPYENLCDAVKEVINPTKTTTVGEIVKAYRERAKAVRWVLLTTLFELCNLCGHTEQKTTEFRIQNLNTHASIRS